MAQPALTRDEAARRAAILEVESYDVLLDLTTSDTTFASTTFDRAAMVCSLRAATSRVRHASV